MQKKCNFNRKFFLFATIIHGEKRVNFWSNLLYPFFDRLEIFFRLIRSKNIWKLRYFRKIAKIYIYIYTYIIKNHKLNNIYNY